MNWSDTDGSAYWTYLWLANASIRRPHASDSTSNIPISTSIKLYYVVGHYLDRLPKGVENER